VSAAAFIVAALAVGRATRLVINDRFPFARPQAWLHETDEGAWFQVMVTCPWCLSGWLSLLTLGVLEWRYSVPLPAVVWFGLWWSAVAAYWLLELLAKYGASDEPPPYIDLDDDEFS